MCTKPLLIAALGLSCAFVPGVVGVAALAVAATIVATSVVRSDEATREAAVAAERVGGGAET